MDLFDFSQTTEAFVTIAVVAGMFALFVRETYPTEVVAIAASQFMGGGDEHEERGGPRRLDQPVERRHDRLLRRVAADLSAVDAIAVGLAERRKGLQAIAERHLATGTRIWLVTA